MDMLTFTGPLESVDARSKCSCRACPIRIYATAQNGDGTDPRGSYCHGDCMHLARAPLDGGGRRLSTALFRRGNNASGAEIWSATPADTRPLTRRHHALFNRDSSEVQARRYAVRATLHVRTRAHRAPMRRLYRTAAGSARDQCRAAVPFAAEALRFVRYAERRAFARLAGSKE